MAPLLSIICPFYGVEAYLADCLDSLRAQTLTDFEVIMVDDGSPDNCRAIAESVAAIDDRFTLLVQQNQGLGPARNTGVRHARGKYLAFVDSDDLVPPRGYELLVTTLERTGSDFAAGNARRFGGELGPRQSWTHRNAFAATRLGTHISEFSSLVEDRMVWNKVYRRSFWDEQGYAFPPIRYEDYPVTLAAHLDAAKVDVLKDPIYLWRERDSNDSITQMAGRVDNARDRVESAHMVLDLMTQDVDQRIVQRLQSYLVDVDLVALANAVGDAARDDKPEIQRLISGLAIRIEPNSGTQRLAKLIHEASSRGDYVVVEALGRWRSTGDTLALGKVLARHLPPSQWADVRKALFRKKRFEATVSQPKRLKVEVSCVEVGEAAFNVSGFIKLRRQFTGAARVRMSLVGSKNPVPLPLNLSRSGNGFTFRVVVPYEKVLEFAGWDTAQRDAVHHSPIDRCTIVCDVQLGPFRWQGRLKMPPEVVPPIVNAEGDVWLQAARQSNSWFMSIWAINRPALITGLNREGDDIVAHLSMSEGALEVVLPEPSQVRSYPVVSGKCSIDVGDLVAGDPLDDPVTRTGHRVIRIRSGKRTYRPFLAVAPAEAVVAERIVRLDTSLTGQAQIDYLPVGPTPRPVEEI